MDLIIGEGLTGSSVASYLQRMNKPYIIWAESKKDQYIDLEIISKNADHIYISPGCRINERPYSNLDRKKIKTDIEVFLNNIKTKNVIAITGTNGKSSLVSLLEYGFKKLGLNSFSLGNNEKPPLDFMDKINNDDWVILELSSFQLAWMQNIFPFKIAGITSFTPDHLNWHLDIKDYQVSKEKIFKNSIINFAPISFKTQKNHFEWPSSYQEVLMNATENEKLFLNNSKAKGPMIICLYQALKIFKKLDFKEDLIFKILSDWAPEPYKYESIYKNKINWINDSKATNVDATLAAFDCLDENKNIFCILGGLSKGQDLSRLKMIDKKASLFLAIGTAAKEIKNIFCEKAICVETIDAAFEEIKKHQKPDIVILSPACSSLDQFKNYKHRGDVFNELVNKFNEFSYE